MAGDQVSISTYAFYNTTVQPPPGGVNLLNEILPVLAGGVINNSGGKILAGDLTNLSNTLNPNVTSFLNSRTYDNARPKAYLNWILFDDQFNYVASNSGVWQITAGSSAQVLSPALQTMSKNGYLYVYVSNESQQDVYFDKLTVKQYSGPLSQEQSYYPFGLQMAGISDKALLRQAAPYKFDEATELEDDYGLNYYNTQYRKYDPQIGRFAGVDGLAEKYISINPYQYGKNNPAMYNDPSGAESIGSVTHTGGSIFSGGSDGEYSGFSDDFGGSGGDGGGGGSSSGADYSEQWAAIINDLWSQGGGVWDNKGPAPVTTYFGSTERLAKLVAA